MYVVPISVKGIVIEDGKVWLRQNERNEWELPGGKLEHGEQPEETVVRELREELGFTVTVDRIVQAHLYTIEKSEMESRGVFVVTYLCTLQDVVGDVEHVGEAGPAQFQAVALSEIDKLSIPQFYKDALHVAVRA